MNLQTLIVAAVLFGIFAGVLYQAVKRWKKGGGGCSSCGCSSSCSICTAGEDRKESSAKHPHG